MSDTSREPARNYPLPPMDDDPRFTYGLLLDVKEVLTSHGYPAFRSGADLLELHMALFHFLYGTGETHGGAR